MASPFLSSLCILSVQSDPEKDVRVRVRLRTFASLIKAEHEGERESVAALTTADPVTGDALLKSESNLFFLPSCP